MSGQAGFPYIPLDAETAEIRLLTLEPATVFEEPLRCTVRHVALDEKLKYEALSYVWGDENNTLPLEVNGYTIQATLNLEAALRHLRETTTPRDLWVDAICINQSDAKEKNEQVLRMTDIYKLAKKVIVWLGKDDDDEQEDDPDHARDWKARGRPSAPEAFTFVYWSNMFLSGRENTPYEVTDFFMDQSDSQQYLRLVELLNRKWFQRMWTLQEIAVATDAEVVCGTASVPWKYLLRTSKALSKPETVPLNEYLYVLPLQRLGEIELCRVEHELFALTGGDPAKMGGYELAPLLNVLFNVAGKRKMKDIRDRIYGILGLYFGSDIWARDTRLRPDYAKPIAHAFTGLARYLIEDHRRISIVCAGQESDIEGIPSWVPTWSSALPGSHLDSYITKMPVGRRSGVDFDPSFSQDGRTLIAKGRCFSYVEFVATPATTTTRPSNDTLSADWMLFMRNIILKWKEEISSCALLRRHYRDNASWKAEFEADFRDFFIGAQKGDDMFYACLLDENLEKILNDGSFDYKDQEDREYARKVTEMDSARWAKRLFHSLAADVPFITRPGEIGLAAKGCRPQIGDMLCILYGVPVPVILREQLGSYRLIGPCRVKGWMGESVVNESLELMVDIGQRLNDFKIV